MKLEEIFDLWELDSKIDNMDLGEESLKIPRLHSKYYQLYAKERLILRKLEAELKELKIDKFEFYTQGPHKETPKDWKMPAKGKLLKSDVGTYLDSDPDIIKLSLKIGLQIEKVEMLDSIIKTLYNRNFLIKNAIDFLKFQTGA